MTLRTRARDFYAQAVGLGKSLCYIKNFMRSIILLSDSRLRGITFTRLKHRFNVSVVRGFVHGYDNL